MSPRSLRADNGMAMAALLVGMSVMAVMMTVAMPAWSTMMKREREAELVFRGQQYARAIANYQAARGAYPPSIDVLVNEKFLRKKYLDPITNDEFQVVRLGQALPGQAPAAAPDGRAGGAPPSGFRTVTREGASGGGGPIIGVVSKSTASSLRLINGRNRYNEAPFTATEATTQAGAAGGTATPGRGGATVTPGGGRGGRGMPTPGRGGRLQLPGSGGRGRGASPQ